MNVTGRAQELLESLRTARRWLSREELAERTGKSRLSPHDTDLLNRLQEAGYVEIETRPAGIAEKYVYRAVSVSTDS